MYGWGYEVNLGRDSEARFGQDFEVKVFSWNADAILRCLSWCLVVILMMKFDQDLCLKKLLWFTKAYKQSSTRCAFGNVFVIWHYGAAETHNVPANVACYEQDNT